MFTRFEPAARQIVVRAGVLATEAGRSLLDTDFVLLALVESHPIDGATPAEVRTEIGSTSDRELLAALGIDLDEVRSRFVTNVDDPVLWELHRSVVRPLRVALSGPTGDLELTGHSRKVMEVALHYARRRNAPVSGKDLLRGLLADHENRSVRILHRLDVDLRQLRGRNAA